MNILKNIGPRTEPWGTPKVIFPRAEGTVDIYSLLSLM